MGASGGGGVGVGLGGVAQLTQLSPLTTLQVEADDEEAEPDSLVDILAWFTSGPINSLRILVMLFIVITVVGFIVLSPLLHMYMWWPLHGPVPVHNRYIVNNNNNIKSNNTKHKIDTIKKQYQYQ